ncbi:MAG: M15 family metallopeptidase [bacterium]|nr:M15 family metallopeptidase [bacterium]
MRDITMLHPRLQELAKTWQRNCMDRGIQVKIGECFRTVAEQDALYAQGRTTPGNIVTNAKGSSYSSQHQWGIAFDFFLDMDINGNGRKDDDRYNDSTKMFEKAAELGKSLGLGWGGDWKSIVDKPHLYLPDWGSGTKKLKEEYKTPERFIRSWEPKYVKGFKPAADGVRWWYQNEDGSFCKNGWFWLQEATGGTWGWYLFDEAGYMLTGYQKGPDERYFFLSVEKNKNEGKCMVTNDQGALQIAEYDWGRKQYIISA